MSNKYALKSDKRDRAGKGIARALRRENKVPGVIYGDGKEPVLITMAYNEVIREYNKGHMYTTLCDMDVAGDKGLVLARDIQLHPVKDSIEHIDFLRVSPKTKITVNVPVHFINEEACPGLEEGGTLNVVRYEVELACSAVNIPDAIEVDLSSFNIGDNVRMSDAVLPEGTTTVIDRDFNLAIIAAPRSEEELEEALEGEEGAEEGEEGEEAAEGEEGAEGEDAAAEDGDEAAEKTEE